MTKHQRCHEISLDLVDHFEDVSRLINVMWGHLWPFHHCAYWWPSTDRWEGIRGQSDDQVRIHIYWKNALWTIYHYGLRYKIEMTPSNLLLHIAYRIMTPGSQLSALSKRINKRRQRFEEKRHEMSPLIKQCIYQGGLFSHWLRFCPGKDNKGRWLLAMYKSLSPWYCNLK